MQRVREIEIGKETLEKKSERERNMRVEDIDQQLLHPLEKKLDKRLQFIDPTKFRSNNHL